MKTKQTLSLFYLITFTLLNVLYTTYSFAKLVPEVIYGNDDRQNINDIQNINLANLSRSTLAKVNPSLFKRVNDLYEIDAMNLGESYFLCSDQRFSDEPTLSSCTGFLINADTLVTAGHCLSEVCDEDYWVLDYVKGRTTFLEENFVKCVTVVKSVQDDVNKIDYAIIKLSRKIENREYFKFREQGSPILNQELAVVGYPVGLPLKIATNGYVRDVSEFNTISTNLDTFHGNSGSPVLNLNTMQVEGILVRGDDDFEIDYDNNCRRVKTCSMDACSGETVMRATAIPKELLK